jgi:hypothetical protein
MDLGEICLEGVGWVHLAQDRDLWQAHVNLLIPYQCGAYWRAECTVSFSRRTLLHGVRRRVQKIVFVITRVRHSEKNMICFVGEKGFRILPLSGSCIC